MKFSAINLALHNRAHDNVGRLYYVIQDFKDNYDTLDKSNDLWRPTKLYQIAEVVNRPDGSVVYKCNILYTSSCASGIDRDVYGIRRGSAVLDVSDTDGLPYREEEGDMAEMCSVISHSSVFEAPFNNPVE